MRPVRENSGTPMVLLEHLDLVADRRVSQAQLLGGLAHAFAPSRGLEALECIQPAAASAVRS
jgi:hypothetical protein